MKRQRLGIRVVPTPQGELFATTAAAPVDPAPAARAPFQHSFMLTPKIATPAPDGPAVAIERVPPHDFDILTAWDRLGRDAQERLLAGFRSSRDERNRLNAPQRADLLTVAMKREGDSAARAGELLRKYVTPAASSDTTQRDETHAAAEAVAEGPQPDPRTAAKLRTVADNMAEKIAYMFNPCVSRQNVTARRSRIAAGMFQEGERLERAQSVIYALADLHENGTIPLLLAGVRNRAQVELLLSRCPDSEGRDFVELHASEIEAIEAVARRYTDGRKYSEVGAVLETLRDPKRAVAMGLDTAEKWDAAGEQLAACGFRSKVNTRFGAS